MPTVFAKSFLLMQDSCQIAIFSRTNLNICRTEDIFVVRILFSLLRFTGHLTDRRKVFAGQNEKMPILSGSPALFAKTGQSTFDQSDHDLTSPVERSPSNGKLLTFHYCCCV